MHITRGDSSHKFDWTAYRAILDKVPDARRAGLLDPDMAAAAVADPESIIDIDEGGTAIPILVPIGHVPGYDAPRCRSMAAQTTGSAEPATMWLSRLPSAYWHSTKADVRRAIGHLAAGHADRKLEVVIFTERPTDVSNADDIPTPPDSWIEDHLVDGDYGPASITLWTSIASPKPPSNHAARTSPAALVEAVCGCDAQSPADSRVTLMPGSSLTDGLADELWALFKDRFQWLGERHPVSMEDERDFFDSLLRHPATLVSAFRSAEAVDCWAWFLADGLARCSWISPSALTSGVAVSGPKPMLLFFPGIVARADNIGNYAEPTLRATAEAVGLTGTTTTIVFETTNRSDLYVPAFVEEYTNRTERMHVEPFRPLETMLYSMWRPPT